MIFEEAIKKDDIEKVRLWTSQMDSDLRNEASQTALMIACAHAATDVALLYLKERSADVKVADALGWTALHHASFKGCLKSIEMLFTAKANLRAVTNYRQTALHIAAEQGYTAVAEFLAQNECPINAKTLITKQKYSSTRKTALHLAIEFNHLETVKKLLLFKADTEETDECSDSALHIAAAKGFLDIAKELIRHRADVNKSNSKFKSKSRSFSKFL